MRLQNVPRIFRQWFNTNPLRRSYVFFRFKWSFEEPQILTLCCQLKLLIFFFGLIYTKMHRQKTMLSKFKSIKHSMQMKLTFIVYWDLYFGPYDVVSLLQTVSSNSRPLTAGMKQEVVIVSESFNQLTCRNKNNKQNTDYTLQSRKYFSTARCNWHKKYQMYTKFQNNFCCICCPFCTIKIKLNIRHN